MLGLLTKVPGGQSVSFSNASVLDIANGGTCATARCASIDNAKAGALQPEVANKSILMICL